MQATPFPSAPARPERKYVNANQAIRNFGNSVAFMIDGENKVEIGQLVESLVTALRGEARKPAVHPLVYVNMAFVLGLAFACGSMWQRMATQESRTSALESKTQAIELIPVVNAKMDMFQQQLIRLQDGMDATQKKR
jgi:hypothetical protein